MSEKTSDNVGSIAAGSGGSGEGTMKKSGTYDVGDVTTQFGESFEQEGFPLGELRDAPLPDIQPNRPQLREGAATGQGPGFVGAYSRNSVAPVYKRGKAIPTIDPALYPFNVVAGSRSGNSIVVGRDDRMSPKEASVMMRKVYECFGIEREPHEFLYDFTQALFLTHALNGASVLGPGRAEFVVGGTEFHYGEIVKILGGDLRRFFRAYADDISRALSSALKNHDPASHDSVRLVGQIRHIAASRGLMQFPYLIHDSADACNRLSPAEVAAVLHAKNFVLRSVQGTPEGMAPVTEK